MDMASNVTASEDTSEDEVTDGPPNSPTGASASASSSSSEDTTAASASSADCASITDTVCAMEGVTMFCELLKSDDSDLEATLNDESEEFTIFAPTDAAYDKISTAFEQLSDEEAGRVIMFHIYELYLTY